MTPQEVLNSRHASMKVIYNYQLLDDLMKYVLVSAAHFHRLLLDD
jgi:hypothetical protein